MKRKTPFESLIYLTDSDRNCHSLKSNIQRTDYKNPEMTKLRISFLTYAQEKQKKNITDNSRYFDNLQLNHIFH